ncbi:hypothetical protein, partial [Streptomyces sp. SID10115]
RLAESHGAGAAFALGSAAAAVAFVIALIARHDPHRPDPSHRPHETYRTTAATVTVTPDAAAPQGSGPPA